MKRFSKIKIKYIDFMFLLEIWILGKFMKMRWELAEINKRSDRNKAVKLFLKNAIDVHILGSKV